MERSGDSADIIPYAKDSQGRRYALVKIEAAGEGVKTSKNRALIRPFGPPSPGGRRTRLLVQPNRLKTGHELMHASKSLIQLFHRRCIRHANVVVRAKCFSRCYSHV